MPRPKGLQKTGGRKKGIPNKKTLEMTSLLNELGCNLIQELVKFAQDKKVDVSIRVKIYYELLAYTYPKRGSLQSSSESLREEKKREAKEYVKKMREFGEELKEEGICRI